MSDRASGALASLRARVAGLLGPAVRAAIVVPSAFALARAVTSDPQTQLFAAFGSFALVIFASFPGGPRRQVRSLAVLVLVGVVFVTAGTACSQVPVAAVASMALVGFAVLFAG
ncbi:MAG: FUSC family protein, partial [Acidimicrobiales bacterium]